MEKTRCLAPNLIFKIKLLALITLLLAGNAFAADFKLSVADDVFFDINKVSVLALKIQNLKDYQVSAVPDFIPSESFTVISPLQDLDFKANEEKLLYYTFLVENTQQLQSFLLPFILRDSQGEEVFREFIKINIKPYTNFQAWLNTGNSPLYDDGNSTLALVLDNDSNIPCIGDILLINGAKIQTKQFYLKAGEADTLQFKTDSFMLMDKFINAKIDIDYKYIYPDSLSSHKLNIDRYLPYYSLYQPDLQRFHKIPAYVSNKVKLNNYPEEDEWEHWLSFWGYGYLYDRDKKPDTFVSWYFKKQNGRFLNSWTDHDEYAVSFSNNLIASTSGKANFQKNVLLGNLYGQGFDINVFPNRSMFSYQLVKDYYREKATYSTISYTFLRDKDYILSENNSLFSLHFQAKRKDFSTNSIIGKDTNSPNDNDKLSTNLCLALTPSLKINNELLWYKNNNTNDEFNFAEPLIYNRLTYSLPSTFVELKHFYQAKKIDGEYDFRKTFEANLSNRFENDFAFLAGFRYSNEKSNYTWSYPYNQVYNSHYLKPKVKIWKSLYAIANYSYYWYESSQQTYNVEDKLLLSGIAFDLNNFYAEALAGKHDYNYNHSKKIEDVLHVNMRYFYRDWFIFVADSKTTRMENKTNQSQFISAETKIYQKLRMSASLQNYHYQGNAWQDMIIGEGNLSYAFYHKHTLTLSAKHYEYLNNHELNRYSVSLEYTMPLNMPVAAKSHHSDLIVEVFDPYTNNPVNNLLIHANGMYGLTNKNGRAEFLNINQGDYLLTAINNGREQLLYPQLPDTVRVEKKEKITKKYNLINPASIHIKVSQREVSPTAGEGVFLANNGKIKLKDIYFVLQNKDTKIIKKTDQNGQIIFNQLHAGTWQVFPLKSADAQTYEFVDDIKEIEVVDDESYSLEFELMPKVMKFESFIDGGKVKIKE